jgi:hypothetical protein
MLKPNFKKLPSHQSTINMIFAPTAIQSQQTKTHQPFLLKTNQRLNNNLRQHQIEKNAFSVNINYNKTIVNVLNYGHGLGDFLRGSIMLAQLAKHFNIHFKLDASRHNISKFLNNESQLLPSETKIHDSLNENDIYKLIQQFINSPNETLYISTHKCYKNKLVSNDIKQCINSFFTFKNKYYETAKKYFNLKKYNVLHIRCKDNDFNSDFEDNNLFSEITKLNLQKNTIIISNNCELKKKINKLFGFYFINNTSGHTGYAKCNLSEFENTIIDFIILSKSSNTYCFSYYSHGSGFSEHCSLLNNIPYRIKILPDADI